MALDNDGLNIEWDVVGYNIRLLRSLQSMTQVEFARVAQVSPATVVSAEQGKPLRKSTFMRLCAALNTNPTELMVVRGQNIKTKERRYLVHHLRDAEWSAQFDRRKRVRENDFEMIQSPEERLRLGRSGLVSVFGTGPSFLMPRGPGILIDEIFQEVEFPLDMYRDYVGYCLAGKISVWVDEDGPIILSPGEMIGFSDNVRLRVGPAQAVGVDDHPPMMMWIAANRKGWLLVGDDSKQRVRKTRG